MKKRIYLISILLLTLFLLAGCSYATDNTNVSKNKETGLQLEPSNKTNYIHIKYRDDSVDLAHSRWEYLDTSKSSFVRGAWYDADNRYIIINLKETNYHYCGLPSSTWWSFKSANSFGTFFNRYIKGNYDCRINPIPKY